MPQPSFDGVAGAASAAVVAVPSVRAAVSGRAADACHSGGYAPTMYLSPRRTLIALRARRTGGLRRGDEVDVGGRVAAAVISAPEGASIPAAGDAGGAIAGSLCMVILPERGPPMAGAPCSLGGRLFRRWDETVREVAVRV
jgi:hypothetical protein